MKIVNRLYKLALKILSKRIVFSETPLTPAYLSKKGWVITYDLLVKKTFWIEPDIKDRDRIYIRFEPQFYQVLHSNKLTFIASEKSLEWFEAYYLLLHPDNGRYDLASSNNTEK